MHYGAPIRLLGPVLQLDYTRNGGAAFSLGGTGYTIVFSLIAVGVVTVILRLARKLFSVRWAIALGLLLGGAIGNLLDRLRSARGVVDFIDIGIGTHRFWTFNFADLGVTLGTAMLTWILCVRAAKEERPRPAPALAPSSALDEPN